MPTPKPREAWSLVFDGGPLAGNAKLWNVTCPSDWAYRDRETGEVTRYRLRLADRLRKVATLEVIPDA